MARTKLFDKKKMAAKNYKKKNRKRRGKQSFDPKMAAKISETGKWQGRNPQKSKMVVQFKNKGNDGEKILKKWR